MLMDPVGSNPVKKLPKKIIKQTQAVCESVKLAQGIMIFHRHLGEKCLELFPSTLHPASLTANALEKWWEWKTIRLPIGFR